MKTRSPDRTTRATRVALAGNPNCGKSSIFNAMTGSRQNVGNYAGVTVEKRSGAYDWQGEHYAVLDLPGTYSLSSFSPEERIAQDELLTGDLDVVVVVVDSSNLKRGLVLMAQVALAGANPVLCLNMADEARKAGQRVDIIQMETLLGFPVVETVGHLGGGVAELKEAIAGAAARPAGTNRVVLGALIQESLDAIAAKLPGLGFPEAQLTWIAAKLLVDDAHHGAILKSRGAGGAAALAVAADRAQALEASTGLDAALCFTDALFGFVSGLLREVVFETSRANARIRSDRIDAILANRIIGLPVFGAVMYLIFWVTFTIGAIPMGWIENGFAALGDAVGGLWPTGSESQLRSLLVDGVIGGVGGVLIFLPNILLLFLGMAFLEDSGYMARAAFLMDKVMHRFGLHGKSFFPLMTGFGCSIPGIMATRTLENERDRLATMLVLPLMSCGARLPVWMLLIPAFFPQAWRAPMLWLIYAVGIVLALVLALILKRSILRGEDAPFVMELPPYRMPTFRAIFMKMFERSWIYVRKAGTVILAISVLMWVIATYPQVDHYRVDEAIAVGSIVVSDQPAVSTSDVEILTSNAVANQRASEDLQYSVAGRIGRFLEPGLRPLGFDWKLATAMIGSFAAKEVFVAQLGIVYSMGETDEESVSLTEALRRDYSPLVGFCLMLFMLISTPCMATIAVTKRESGSWKWALLQLGGLTAIAYILTLVTFQVGSLIV